MDLLLQLLGYACSLISFVCFVVVVVKMFQNKQTVLGVVSIIGLPCLIGYVVALVVGWKNRTAWKLERVMPIFALTFCISIVTTGILVANAWKQGVQQRDQPNSEFDSDLEVPEILP